MVEQWRERVHGIVRAAAVGIQSRQLLCQLGVPLHLAILCDSSAARERCTRSGSGKVRHLTIKEQWMQEALWKGVLNLRVVDTLLCWADIWTKSLEKDRLDSLMLQMPLSRREGQTARVAVAALSFLTASTSKGHVHETTAFVGAWAVGRGQPRSALRRTGAVVRG